MVRSGGVSCDIGISVRTPRVCGPVELVKLKVWQSYAARVRFWGTPLGELRARCLLSPSCIWAPVHGRLHPAFLSYRL